MLAIYISFAVLHIRCDATDEIPVGNYSSTSSTERYNTSFGSTSVYVLDTTAGPIPWEISLLLQQMRDLNETVQRLQSVRGWLEHIGIPLITGLGSGIIPMIIMLLINCCILKEYKNFKSRMGIGCWCSNKKRLRKQIKLLNSKRDSKTDCGALIALKEKLDTFDEPNTDLFFRILDILAVIANTGDAAYSKKLGLTIKYSEDYIEELTPEDIQFLTKAISSYKDTILDYDSNVPESMLDSMHQKLKAQLGHRKRHSNSIYDPDIKFSSLTPNCRSVFLAKLQGDYSDYGVSDARLVESKSVVAIVFSDKQLPFGEISTERPLEIPLDLGNCSVTFRFKQLLSTEILNEKTHVDEAKATVQTEVDPCESQSEVPSSEIMVHCEGSKRTIDARLIKSNDTSTCLNYGTHQCAGTTKMARRCRNRRHGVEPVFCHHHKDEQEEYSKWRASGAPREGCKKENVYRDWWHQFIKEDGPLS